MNIRDFIQQQILLPRLRDSEVLVVYDPERRYHDLCLALGGEQVTVVDASAGSITGRLEALGALQALGRGERERRALLVYVPARRPLTDEEKQRDPFALYGECGAVFPAQDSDEYLNLCLRARAESPTEIRRIFAADPNPPFEVIDAVGGGPGYPTLRARLGAESAYDLLFTLLTPSERQLQALNSGAAGIELWAGEVRALCQAALGLDFRTRSSAWSVLGEELWRFLLFSEFAFDLPEDALPQALAAVPRARPDARPLVEDLCERLRSDQRHQPAYIERAETVERELQLPELCRGIADLGQRDTFPFEERTCFRQAVDALRAGDLDALQATLERHNRSVWVGRGENQAQWQLLQAAGALLRACQDAEALIPDLRRSQDDLLDAYLTSLREVDRLQREFEQAGADLFSGAALPGAALPGAALSDGGVTGAGGDEIEAAAAQARRAYRRLANRLQEVFLHHLEREGWPPPRRLSNAAVFDQFVAPRLQESGRRTALLLIDALRYELGVELQRQLARQLAGEGQIELQAACAPLPSITPLGMAALLPGAADGLALGRKDDGIQPLLGGAPALTVAQRMDVLRRRYGQRFAEMPLSTFVRARGGPEEAVELLVLRSNEMDEQFESNPEAALGLIGRTFNQVRAAIHKLRGLGFQEVVIAADHGFYLNFSDGPGDVCARPPGSWISVHERLLLGDGGVGGGDVPGAGAAGAGSGAANLVLPAALLGMRGDFNQAALPRAMAAYRAGLAYFHGGASLQEALVPVMRVRLSAAQTPAAAAPKVTLSYKRGARKITTRLPVVEVAVEPRQGELFAGPPAPVEVRLEAQDARGRVVGEARLGGPVNPATGTLLLDPGQTLQVTIKMEMDFEGKFTIKALDPQTLKALAKALELETDYAV